MAPDSHHKTIDDDLEELDPDVLDEPLPGSSDDLKAADPEPAGTDEFDLAGKDDLDM